jgi:hypothetical protein
MSESRPPAYDVSTERAIKHLFPREAEEAVRLELTPERKPAGEAQRTVETGAEQRDDGAKDFALRRLRESPDEELALFEDTLRRDALRSGATEQELREAQSGHPEHG